MVRYLPTNNLSSSFGNGTSGEQNATCDLLINSLLVKIAEIIVFSIILLSSFVGNVLIIIIVYRSNDLKKTTNFFIVNMAVSDFVCPLAMIPFSLARTATSSWQWPISGFAGLIFCKLKGILEDASGIVSIQSLLWIALDRFLGVVFPMKAHLISSRFRAIAIFSTWIVGMGVTLLDFNAYDVIDDGEKRVCTDYYINILTDLQYGRITALFYFVPLITMAILYSVIAVTLRRQDKVLRCTAVNGKGQRKKRAIKMTFCLTASFYLCGLPMLLSVIFREYDIVTSCSFYKVFMPFAVILLYLTATVNPIICLTFVQNYRYGLKELCISRWSERQATGDRKTCKQEQITLQEVRAIS